MIDHVDRTLQKWRSSAFTWGVSDCMQSVATYIRDVTGRDVSGGLCGTYSTEQEAAALVIRAGGEIAMLDWSGLPKTERLQRGDIVLCRIRALLYAGICTGDGFAFRTPMGVVEIDNRFVRVVQAWEFSECRQ
jgi:hypothetical protein